MVVLVGKKLKGGKSRFMSNLRVTCQPSAQDAG
jgi:hypothetical protein